MASLPFQIGHYVLFERLGGGGMGEVYLGYKLGEPATLLAIKVLDENSTDLAKQRFELEAQMSAGLKHPSIIQFHEILHDGATSAIVMEYIEGVTVADVIDRLPSDGPLSFDAIYNIARVLADVLVYLSRQQTATGSIREVIHGDLTPQNLMVSFDGELKLIDFGISRFNVENDYSKMRMTLANAWYASPNRLNNGAISPSDDLFGFGMILWELSTGQRYYGYSSKPEILNLARDFEVQDPRGLRKDLPAPLAELIMGCLNAETLNGVTTAEDLAEVLKKITPENLSQELGEEMGPLVSRLFAREKSLSGEVRQRTENLKEQFFAKEKIVGSPSSPSSDKRFEKLSEKLSEKPSAVAKPSASHLVEPKSTNSPRKSPESPSGDLPKVLINIAAVIVLVALLAGVGVFAWRARAFLAQAARSVVHQAAPAIQSRISSMTAEQMASQPKAPASAPLKVRSNPPGQIVLMNGSEVGRTPLEVTLPNGTASLEMTSRSGQPISVILDNKARAIEFDLERGDYDLRYSD